MPKSSASRAAAGALFPTDRPGRAYFDRKDYALLRIVRDVIDREDAPSQKRLLAPYMHPHGIKEMAATRGLRIAYAVVHLLGSLETGTAEDRLSALRSLHGEVLTTAESWLRRNTARVLVQLMKDMVRTNDPLAQLMYAHDFSEACSGKPRIIRRHLARYHLLEMPENQSQLTFDDHVHDANTKGRKSSTHLVLDAWIKGIKSLTVVYYNYVPREAAAELLEAARVLELDVRIGIEFTPRFRGRFLKIIWVPGGFTNPSEFLDFIEQPATAAFMAEGRIVSRHHQRYVNAVFARFNAVHRKTLARDHGLQLPVLSAQEFQRFVGAGQASVQHLGKFIHEKLLPLMREQAAFLRHELASASPPERTEIRQQLSRLAKLDSDEIIEQFLRPRKNPGLPNPDVPSDDPAAPALLRLTPQELTTRLQEIHPAGRITLSLGNLRVEEVLEILYDCRGTVTHLEIVNMKDRVLGRDIDRMRISALRDALNTSNVIKLKRLIRDIIESVPTKSVREKLEEILFDIATLHTCYRKKPLAACVGTDSTGQSSRLYGMGLVVEDTLPLRARHALRKMPEATTKRLDVQADASLRVTELPEDDRTPERGVVHALAATFPSLRFLEPRRRRVEWVAGDCRLTPGRPGNVSLMGGVQRENGPECGLAPATPSPRKPRWLLPPRYFNSGLKIALKIIGGFIPAALTFILTKDWWVLAYLGAFIWFAITGIRNIIQMVVATGGLTRSSLLRWDSLVSWERLADSLLYTGISVPLLDYVIKTELLNRACSITLDNAPLTLYTVVALANALYITFHNVLRGLPRGTALGNWFRSIVSIPLALAYSWVIVLSLRAAGHADAIQLVEPWAAIISKLASDTAAGFIEGFVDRAQASRLRQLDYKTKLAQLFDAFQKLELRFPQEDVLALLESPRQFMLTMSYEDKGLENIIIVNALDLLYFWMYQPRARCVMAKLLTEMSVEERKVFLLSQYVLLREREISQLFLDGLVGKNFARALSFYLDHAREYLEDLQALAAGLQIVEEDRTQSSPPPPPSPATA